MPIFETEVVIYILVGLMVILISWIIRLEVRLHKILGGKKAQSVENVITSIQSDMKDMQSFKLDSINYLKNIEARLKRSIQAIETIRFNPFKGSGSGGNQSFSTVFMSEKGDGVVVSSLYSRDHISVFSKPLKKFSSEFEMTEEEREVTQKAKESLVYQNQNEKN